MLLDIAHFVHLVGIALGVGGATIHTVLSFKAGKDQEIRRSMAKITPIISNLIVIAVILLLISGLGLKYLSVWPIDRNILLIKHSVVGLLILNGAYLNLAVFRKLKKEGLKEEEFAKIQRRGKISGLISIFLWYAILVLSVML